METRTPNLAPVLLGIRDSARFLGTTQHVIRRLISDGSIPYVHLGKRFLLDPDDLLKLVRDRKQLRRIIGCES